MLITISDIPIFPDDGIWRGRIKIQSPSNCPMCNSVTQIEPLNNWLIQKDDENAELFSFYFCSKCEKFFYWSLRSVILSNYKFNFLFT